MHHVTRVGDDPAIAHRFNENAIRAALGNGASPELAAAGLMATRLLVGDFDGQSVEHAQHVFNQLMILAYGIAIEDFDHRDQRLPGQVHGCELVRMALVHHATVPVRRTMTTLSLRRRPGQ